MADEVIIAEYKLPKGGLSSSIGGQLITTQVLDIASLSAELDAETVYVNVTSKGTAFWLTLGDSSASAAANTDGNIYVPADTTVSLFVDNLKYIDTAADA